MIQPQNPEGSRPPSVRILIPWITFIKILLVIAAVSALKALVSLVFALSLAVFLAVTLDPVVLWFEKRRVGRAWSVACLGLIIFLSLLICVTTVAPALLTQTENFIHHLPALKEQLLSAADGNHYTQQGLQRIWDSSGKLNPMDWVGHVVTAGEFVLGGITQGLLILVLGLYLLLDGRAAYHWLMAFVPRSHRERVTRTGEEAGRVISAYVLGQAITSALCFLFVFVAMSVIGLDGALLLGVIAAICDVLPLLGFFISLVPAVLVAASVSAETVLLVLVLYGVYHLIEAYVILPAVYGSRLRVSTLVVLISLLAGGLVGGIPGAILVLPLVAIYPIIERHLLSDYLGRGVVQAHAADVKELEKDG